MSDITVSVRCVRFKFNTAPDIILLIIAFGPLFLIVAADRESFVRHLQNRDHRWITPSKRLPKLQGISLHRLNTLTITGVHFPLTALVAHEDLLAARVVYLNFMKAGVDVEANLLVILFAIFGRLRLRILDLTLVEVEDWRIEALFCR